MWISLPCLTANVQPSSAKFDSKENYILNLFIFCTFNQGGTLIYLQTAPYFLTCLSMHFNHGTMYIAYLEDTLQMNFLPLFFQKLN